MSTTEFERNPSQDPPQSRKPGNSTQPEAQHRPGNKKPLPFDDGPNDVDDPTKSSNPTLPPPGQDL